MHLQLARVFVRQQMLNSSGSPALQARWAVTLTNLIDAERLIFDRNLNAAYVLQAVLVQLTGEIAEGLLDEETLLQRIVT